MLLLFSVAGILAKVASGYSFLSTPFLFLYLGELVIFAAYAIAWQQIIKHIELSKAYANRSVTIVWSCVWGGIFFDEQFTVGKIIGGLLVICGILLYNISDKKVNLKDIKYHG